MIASMTGFARVQGEHGGNFWVWEVKSVNARGLDIRVRLPSGHDVVETAVREEIVKRFRRGSFNVSLNLRRIAGEDMAQINRPLLEQLIAVTAEYSVASPNIESLLAVRGVLTSAQQAPDEVSETARQKACSENFQAALITLQLARVSEGARLMALLDGHLFHIEEFVKEAESAAAARPDAVRQRMKSQLAELLDKPSSISEERLFQELALIAVKNDVREEIDRLVAHIEQARDLITEGEAVGRRLDFLCQEFNREANTLCAKSNDVELTRIGMALKASIDQLREQVQNVE